MSDAAPPGRRPSTSAGQSSTQRRDDNVNTTQPTAQCTPRRSGSCDPGRISKANDAPRSASLGPYGSLNMSIAPVAEAAFGKSPRRTTRKRSVDDAQRPLGPSPPDANLGGKAICDRPAEPSEMPTSFAVVPATSQVLTPVSAVPLGLIDIPVAIGRGDWARHNVLRGGSRYQPQLRIRGSAEGRTSRSRGM